MPEQAVKVTPEIDTARGLELERTHIAYEHSMMRKAARARQPRTVHCAEYQQISNWIQRQ